MRTSTRLASGSCLSLIAALMTYVSAVFVGHFYDLRSADEFCTGKTLAGRPLEWTLFPPSQRCRWSDGTTSDLVPWYLDVLLFGFLGLAVILTALAVRSRIGRPPPAESEKIIG
jgi:hypothetical protein